MQANNSNSKAHVFVNAFARLHMGFLDLNGQSGRRFGSLGVGLDAPDTLVEVAIGGGVFNNREPSYIAKYKDKLLAYIQKEQPEISLPEVSIKVHREIPRHFGLGSGTQMALAIGEGFNQLLKLKMTPVQIAKVTGRGQRSGIGVATFVDGGLVLDDGRHAATLVPEVIEQHAFPEAWRILLIFDHQHTGVHGDEEREAFASLPDASLEATKAISRQVMTHALPAIESQDLGAFGEVVKALQTYTGDYFAPAQGGRYASNSVAMVLNSLAENGVGCVGQSSWGPTGFAVFENQAVAQEHLQRLQIAFENEGLTYRLCAARNKGACVNVEMIGK